MLKKGALAHQAAVDQTVQTEIEQVVARKEGIIEVAMEVATEVDTEVAMEVDTEVVTVEVMKGVAWSCTLKKVLLKPDVLVDTVMQAGVMLAPAADLEVATEEVTEAVTEAVMEVVMERRRG